MATELSTEDKEFLAKCEEELKDRYTANDEEYMKVFNKPPTTPPIMENYWLPTNNFSRNNRRNNKRFHDHRDRHDNQHDRRDRHHSHPYDRRDRQGGSDRGYNNYNNYNQSRYY